MADSVDRVFAHALSTVRKIPRTGSARPPPAERLRLYGLYKQAMEGDVAGVMERPTNVSSAESKAEVDKWDAWHACEGLGRTASKRGYIEALIRTMHTYAAGTSEARALVEELEFVWEQVRGNTSEADKSSPEGRRSSGSPSGGPMIPTRTTSRGSNKGLRVLRPMSDNDVQSEGAGPPLDEPLPRYAAGDADDDADADADSFADAPSSPPHSRSSSPLPTDPAAAAALHWRRRVSRALVQLTAEVAALRELADGSSTSALGRYWARARRRRRGWLGKAWVVLWALSKRVLIDAAVVAVLVVVLRWRWRAKVESAWEVLGVWLGFVSTEMRGRLTEGVREGWRGARMGVGMVTGKAPRAGGAEGGRRE